MSTNETNCDYDNCPAKLLIEDLRSDLKRSEDSIYRIGAANRQNENTITKLSGDVTGYMLNVDTKIENLKDLFLDWKRHIEKQEEQQEKKEELEALAHADFKQKVYEKLDNLAPAKWKINLMWSAFIFAGLTLVSLLGWFLKNWATNV